MSLQVGERVALAMRRGVVTKVTEHGFWIQLDGKSEDVKTWVGFEEPFLEERLEGTPPQNLRDELTRAIDRYSAENGSNTPDFILAEYLVDCLTNFDKAVTRRAAWYGQMNQPGGVRKFVREELNQIALERAGSERKV